MSQPGSTNTGSTPNESSNSVSSQLTAATLRSARSRTSTDTFSRSHTDRLGLLLVNLGSPDSCSPKDVKKYLHQFLNDPYVIDLPTIFRKLLVNGLILNTRPKKSAEAYQKIWTPQGSPLVVHTKALTKKVKEKFSFPVEFGMRYGNPSIESSVRKLIAQGANHIILLPLYPQYSYAASETAIVEFERVIDLFSGRVFSTIIEDFYEQPSFIEALASSIRPKLEETKPDLVLFSYHGIPIRQTTKTRNHKNYQEQCLKTTELVVDALRLPQEKVMTTFQSRLGPTQWIQPFTDIELKELPKKGFKNILVVSPSFTADCLETLEEIEIRYRDLFLFSGGEEFNYVPCLNSSDSLVETIQEIVNPHIPFAKSL